MRYTQRGDEIVDIAFDKMGHERDMAIRFEQKTLESRRRANNSLNRRTREQILQQQNHRISTAQAKKRKEELEKELNIKIPEIIEKLVAAAEVEGVDKAMERYAADVEALKNFNIEHMSLDVLLGFEKPDVSFYNKFFEALTKRNAEFLRFAPVDFLEKDLSRVITKTSCKNKKELLAAIQERLESENSFAENRVDPRNLKFFPDYISKIEEHEDAIFALTIDYTKYPQLNPIVKKNLENYDHLLCELLSKVPAVFEFLSLKDIARLYHSQAFLIGNALYQYPKNLDRLPDGFFGIYNPKFVFAHGLTKAKIRERFSGLDLSRFKELTEYYGLSNNTGLGV